LSKDELKDMLLKLPYVLNELKRWKYWY
jgi:hypothetical protein